MLNDVQLTCRQLGTSIYTYTQLQISSLQQAFTSTWEQLHDENIVTLVLCIIELLMTTFHNMCLVVLTLGVHGLLDSWLVASYMGMLFIIGFLQLHLEEPDKPFMAKILLAVFQKMLVRRNFCPIANTVFMQAPENIEVYLLGHEALDDPSKNVLVCFGFMPGTCSEKSGLNEWLLTAINICVYMSFLIHVVGRQKNDDPMNNKIELLQSMYFSMLVFDRVVKCK
jgi:hypothetical protein